MEIQLPEPIIDSNTSIEKCIITRESIRKFEESKIELEKLSNLFWAAQGKKGSKRCVPSAGATYPLDVYGLIKGKGLFLYHLQDHKLILKSAKEQMCQEIAKAAWDQTFICEAYLNIIICADFTRTTKSYGERGVRYVLMEVGHCAQNIHLEAVALGLASVPIGAFKDNLVKKIMELPDNIDPLYIVPIGYKQ